MKFAKLLPGITSSFENNTGINIRGGKAEQTLLLIDEAALYNSGHAFGLLSSFDFDAIKDLKIYKNYVPPEYGGRASGVIDIKLKEGNKNHFSLGSTAGLMSTKVNVQGPLLNKTNSYFISMRKSYLDLLFSLLESSPIDYNIFDGAFKTNISLSPEDKLYLSTYYSKDKVKFYSVFEQIGNNTEWSNNTITGRFTKIISDKIFFSTALYFTYTAFLLQLFHFPVITGSVLRKSSNPRKAIYLV